LSRHARCFVTQPCATKLSKTNDNPRFAGSFVIISIGANGMPDLLMVTGEQDFDLELDITLALRKMSSDEKVHNVKLVAVDRNGDPAPAEQLDIERSELFAGRPGWHDPTSPPPLRCGEGD
jgi:hypothetical protein